MRISRDVYNKLVNNSITVKENKYKNKKATYDGITFDSTKEKNRYVALKQLESFGIIKDLKTQVPYLLIDTISYRRIWTGR